MSIRLWVPHDSGNPGEKGHELTWFLGTSGSSSGAANGHRHLPGLHHVPVLAGPVVMLGPHSGLLGVAEWLNAQGSGQLWCLLGGSTGGVVPLPAGHSFFLQVCEALLSSTLLRLQGQTPVAPIRDLEGAGSRPVFAAPKGWGWEVGAQHGAASP